MNEIIAIICEYNPFHNGHKYQIDKIKEMYPDSTVLAIMSGNVTQRGEFALFDKYSRAKSAVICGVDCVFELPYPFSASNAEVFAKAGVYLAVQLGATHLCFGSENENIDYIISVADAIENVSRDEVLKLKKQDKSISYPKIIEKICGKDGKIFPHMSNLILGVEYVRAIRNYGNKIIPIAIKREGFGYNDLTVGEKMSASAIRKCFFDKGIMVSVPDSINQFYKELVDNKEYIDNNEIIEFLFRSVLIMSPEQIENCYDVPSGMGYFICDIASNSNNGKDFFEKLTTKTYTYARLRRVVLYSILGIKNIDTEPAYTILLSSNSKGREHLKVLKKQTVFPILTKLADYKRMNEKVIKQFEASSKADKIFISFLRNSSKPTDFIKKMPYIL
ncbi:MAG: nucleotidyltransferase family protein [Clostridia bacterium]|nr:nucleotidyltransferase family protein [Clostridia bacterium]